MTLLLWLKAVLIGVVEGVTEFLPISSTAHILIVQDWVGFQYGHLATIFEVVIQLGAILAVVVFYHRRLFQMVCGVLTGDKEQTRFVVNLILATIPAGVLGVLFIKTIEGLLGNHFLLYATTLFVGGMILLWVEGRPHMAKSQEGEVFEGQVTRLEDMTAKQAIVVGCAQCIAMVPGVSRSGATIVAAMLMGVHRKTATEFTFFLAIPTMLGASLLSLLKGGTVLTTTEWGLLSVGFVMAFISALIVIKGLLHFVSKHSYKAFGWYRIIFGLFIALMMG
ncbi:MAG: undecaprenyl-diphosphate phosphatase [Alcaligenaceae bacterium]|nr:undecaprenyl-diphosphate phosphatase [Alcaligenaceae bacterium]